MKTPSLRNVARKWAREQAKKLDAMKLPALVPMASDGRLVLVLAHKGMSALIEEPQTRELRRVALIALRLK